MKDVDGLGGGEFHHARPSLLSCRKNGLLVKFLCQAKNSELFGREFFGWLNSRKTNNKKKKKCQIVFLHFWAVLLL